MIKGNAAEIGALTDSNEVCRRMNPVMTPRVTETYFLFKVNAQGVDSLGGFKDASDIVRSLARTHRS